MIFFFIKFYSSLGNPSPTIHWYWNNRRLDTMGMTSTIFQWQNFTLRSTSSSSMENNDSRFNVINIGLVKNQTIYDHIIIRHSSSSSSSLFNVTKKLPTSENNSKHRILSILFIRHIERMDQGTIIRCQSTNSPQVPQSKSLNKLFKINVNCMYLFIYDDEFHIEFEFIFLVNPTKAQIVDVRRDGMTIGSMVHATCLTWGSKPPAKIFWFIHDRPLSDIR